MTTLLDFDLTAQPEAIDDDGLIIEDSGPQPVPPSPTALNLDKWSMRQGERLCADEEYTAALGLDPAAPRTEQEQHLAADIRAAAYEPDPQLAESCVDPLRKQFITELLNTPDWQGLRASTVYDDMSADLATVHGSRQYLALVKAQAEAKASGKTWDPEMQAIKAAADATRQAKEEVNDYQDACKSIGGMGSNAGKLDPKKSAELFKRIRGNRQLKRIAELAGRYRMLAQAQQRKKSIHGQDDMVGIVQDGDLARLVPAELAQLADEDTELLALRRIVERQAQCREYRGIEHVARGPIVVVVDESGSMSGEPIANAKALALALAWIARNQNRWVALVGFAGGTEGTRLALPPGKWDEGALLDWLEHFYNGGTDCDVPLVQLPTVYWQEFIATGLQRGKTDVIILTDAMVDVPNKIRKQFNDWKASEQVKLQAIIIGSRDAGELATVSDDVYLVPCLGVEEAAVADVLSV